MKNRIGISTAFLLAGIVLTSFVIAADQSDNKPIAVYQVGHSKVIVWENKTNNGGTWKNFEIEKIYKRGDTWATTNSFNDTELIELRAAIDKAIGEEVVEKE